MARYGQVAKSLSPASKLLIDKHNAVYLIPRRLAESETNPLKKIILNRESKLLTRFEVNVCRHADYVVWVTEEDRQAVLAAADPAYPLKMKSTVIPICADPAGQEVVSGTTGKCRVTFLGGLHWPPNARGILWFAQEVFPQIRMKNPDVVLTVIGKNPPAGLTGPGIEVTGYVADLKPLLEETAVFIVPLQAGGGMRVKILDAWSWGLPIVSTTIGAEGIEVVDTENMLIADTPQAFAKAVLRVFDEPGLAQKLIVNGRKAVLEKYNWQTVYAQWDQVYQAISQQPRPAVTAG
jgi:glycosyltransferase involved in cell wall biosynthesis